MAQGRDVQQGTSTPVSSVCSASGHQEERISVRISHIMPWLADAANNGVAWLRDFEDEEICVTADLYDVILAYQHFHQR